MNVSSDDLRFCLDQANLIADNYQLNAQDATNPERSMRDLLRSCEDALGARVVVCRVLAPTTAVQGMCLLSDDKNVEIALANDLNTCWTRFVLMKELFHLALDRAEYRNINIAGHVEEYVLAFPDDNARPRKPVVAEFLAEVGAMELLFPYGRRAKALNDSTDYLEIATRHRIPKVYAQRYLSTSYMENLGRFSRM
ncbi:MAG: hypothetical protein H6929_20045 [Rhodoferax sp.]|nr:hypothetical protein [Rhodoferax sp.]